MNIEWRIEGSIIYSKNWFSYLDGKEIDCCISECQNGLFDVVCFGSFLGFSTTFQEAERKVKETLNAQIHSNSWQARYLKMLGIPKEQIDSLTVLEGWQLIKENGLKQAEQS